jgi:hypothetical protein
MMPRFREELGEIRSFYERILEQTFGVSEGIWLGTPFNLNLERERGELARRIAGHPSSAPGALGRKGWLDCPGGSQDCGIGNAGLSVGHGAGHWTLMNLEFAGSLRRLFRRLVRRPMNWRLWA